MTPLAAANRLLRGRELSRRWTASLALVCTVLSGAVMGSFGGVDEGRWLQIALTAAKLPALGIVSFLVALPSFVVLNLLLGVGRDLPEVLALLIRSQAVLAVILLAFAPLTLLWYASITLYPLAVLGNATLLGLATFTAQITLTRDYRPLVTKRPIHARLRWAWLGVFAFVAIQMAWVLRPFIGEPNAPVQILRENAWGNAYVVVGKMIWSLTQ